MVSQTPISSLTDDELKALFSRLGFVTASDSMAPLLRQAGKAAHVSDITLLIVVSEYCSISGESADFPDISTP